MTMLAEMLPEAAYLTWLNITPVDKVKNLPESWDKLCPDALDCFAIVTVAEVIPAREWEFAAGRKSIAVAVCFETKTGKSKPLVFTSKRNAWDAMKIWGNDPAKWVGQKCKLYVAKDKSPSGGLRCCLRMRPAQ